MRFLALVRKELHECIPWILLAVITFLAVGGFFFRQIHQEHSDSLYRFYCDGFTSGPNLRLGYWTRPSSLQLTGPVLLLTSIALGLVLGVRHFWIPHFTRTWPFLLHHSVSRVTIFLAKLAAAAVGFIISVGVVWLTFYWKACQPQPFSIPPPLIVFIEGWIFIALGLVAYLGAALTGLSTARWYTTKIFGVGFAGIIILLVFTQWQLIWVFMVMVIGSIILLSQIIRTIQYREF